MDIHSASDVGNGILYAQHRITGLFKDYCGILNEETVRMNFTLAYEVLDEVIVRCECVCVRMCLPGLPTAHVGLRIPSRYLHRAAQVVHLQRASGSGETFGSQQNSMLCNVTLS